MKARPDYEPLFSILDGMHLDAERRFWIEQMEPQEDNCDIEENTGHMCTDVEMILRWPVLMPVVSISTLDEAAKL